MIGKPIYKIDTFIRYKTMNYNESKHILCFDSIYEIIKANTYVCDVCHDIIYPQVVFEDNNVNIIKESRDIRGGKSNKIKVKNVCEKCQKSMELRCRY